MTITELAPTYRYVPPRRLNSLSIVMPARNRADTIRGTIRRAVEVASMVADRYEVVIVDDGSTDATAAIVARMAEKHGESIRLVRHDHTLGYGAMVRRGWSAARMEWLLSVDSDRQFDLANVADFVPLTDRADIIVGRRRGRRDALWRRAGTRVFNAAAQAVLPHWGAGCQLRIQVDAHCGAADARAW